MPIQTSAEPRGGHSAVSHIICAPQLLMSESRATCKCGFQSRSVGHETEAPGMHRGTRQTGSVETFAAAEERRAIYVSNTNICGCFTSQGETTVLECDDSRVTP